MINRVEKLSLLSEMIAFAKYDKDIRRIEYNFLLGVAKQLDISREDFEYLLENPISYTHLKSHSERIVQFHRLVLLMNIEQQYGEGDDNNRAGVTKLYNFGLRMGLSHESITKVLYLMESFPNKIVPPDVLIDIFKTQYN
ncbi:TerB family tellurite resistance protein [Flavobacteriaceae bacterium SZ-1-7]|uniref:TerB family tellurite resistance protein n=1 Tax=Tamlana sedimenti TaxID=3134126 RepID=UPI0031282441